MATRKDVAKLANVSPTSVSYYINDSGYVSQEKRERIEAAIKELNYRPNLIARSLKVQKTNQLLLVCNEIRNPFYSELVYYTTKFAYQHGYVMMFSNIINDQDYIETICDYQISGVIFATNQVTEDQINYVAGLGIPTLTIGNMSWKDLNSDVTRIKIDAYHAIKDLVKLMTLKGHDDIAFISSCPSYDLRFVDGKTKGFIDGCEAAGTFDESTIIYNIADAKKAHLEVLKALNAGFKPRAFICTNDAVATGTLRALNEYGLSVPKDAIVSGFDNTDSSQMSIPSLTTVDLELDKVSELAINSIVKRINKESVEDMTIKTTTIEREST